MKNLGRQWMIELHECDPEPLKRAPSVETAMVEAARRCRATIVSVSFHEFSPFGVSGMVVIAESHLAIHTWPEFRYAAVDVFTCGETLHPGPAAEHLARAFGARVRSVYEFPRGRFDAGGRPVTAPPLLREMGRAMPPKPALPEETVR